MHLLFIRKTHFDNELFYYELTPILMSNAKATPALFLDLGDPFYFRRAEMKKMD